MESKRLALPHNLTLLPGLPYPPGIPNPATQETRSRTLHVEEKFHCPRFPGLGFGLGYTRANDVGVPVEQVSGVYAVAVEFGSGGFVCFVGSYGGEVYR